MCEIIVPQNIHVPYREPGEWISLGCFAQELGRIITVPEMSVIDMWYLWLFVDLDVITTLQLGKSLVRAVRSIICPAGWYS